MLRFWPPVLHFRRTATRDLTLAGRPIRAGEKVVVYHAAANRDPSAFPDPDRFDIARTPNDHVSFGFGPHFCLGAHLARPSSARSSASCSPGTSSSRAPRAA
jgi:cytochrome P450